MDLKRDKENPPTDVLSDMLEVLNQEARAIDAVGKRLDASIERVIDQLFECNGRVIVTGMGKMGCIARKATATFCSTGTPAIFLHPSEAVHGDLGIVTPNDVLVVLSKSGETRELMELVPFMVRHGVPIIGLVGNPNSSLSQRCNFVIDIAVESEADTIAEAPTSSTTVALAMCDSLAVALMSKRGFTKEQFAIFHPGGHLGGKLLLEVADLMHTGDTIPVIHEPGKTLADAIAIISEKGMGAVFVLSDANKVIGVVTDGDLRRVIERANDGSRWNVWRESLSKHMTASPKMISVDALAAEALRLMEDNGITVLPVVDDQTKIVGIIHLHDLVRAGLA